MDPNCYVGVKKNNHPSFLDNLIYLNYDGSEESNIMGAELNYVDDEKLIKQIVDGDKKLKFNCSKANFISVPSLKYSKKFKVINIRYDRNLREYASEVKIDGIARILKKMYSDDDNNNEQK